MPLLNKIEISHSRCLQVLTCHEQDSSRALRRRLRQEWRDSVRGLAEFVSPNWFSFFYFPFRLGTCIIAPLFGALMHTCPLSHLGERVGRRTRGAISSACVIKSRRNFLQENSSSWSSRPELVKGAWLGHSCRKSASKLLLEVTFLPHKRRR